MPQQKQSIVTFKADNSLVQALRGVPNRSDFIRSAVLAALDSMCPVCRGTGILTREQKKHWDAFAADHAVEECDTCHEWYVVCRKQGEPQAHKTRRPPTGKRGKQP